MYQSNTQYTRTRVTHILQTHAYTINGVYTVVDGNHKAADKLT